MRVPPLGTWQPDTVQSINMRFDASVDTSRLQLFVGVGGSGRSPLECTTLNPAVGISYLNRAVQPLELLGVTGSRHHFATLPTYVAPSCAIVQFAVSLTP